MEILSKINKPLYGIAGNHDEWARLPFDDVRTVFRKTGGDWLTDTDVLAANGRVELTGSSCKTPLLPAVSRATPAKRILMVHYPEFVDTISDRHFDLILAGHTHGGQVRLPFIGGLIDLGHYEKGLYRTAAGPFYVNPGLGTFYHDMRFFCRPEVTIIEL